MSCWSTNLLLTKTFKSRSQWTIEQIWKITETLHCVEQSLMILWTKTMLNFEKSIRRRIKILIVLISQQSFTKWNLFLVVQSRLLARVIWQYIQSAQCFDSMKMIHSNWILRYSEILRVNFRSKLFDCTLELSFVN